MGALKSVRRYRIALDRHGAVLLGQNVASLIADFCHLHSDADKAPPRPGWRLIPVAVDTKILRVFCLDLSVAHTGASSCPR